MVKKKKKPASKESGDKVLKKLDKSFEDDVPLSAIANKDSKKSSLEEDLPLSKILSTPQIVESKSETSMTNIKPVSTHTTVLTSNTLLLTTSVAVTNAVTAATKANSTTMEGVKPTVTKVESPLPPGLGDDILGDINKLKVFAESCVKGKFFIPEVNSVLLE